MALFSRISVWPLLCSIARCVVQHFATGLCCCLLSTVLESGHQPSTVMGVALPCWAASPPLPRLAASVSRKARTSPRRLNAWPLAALEGRSAALPTGSGPEWRAGVKEDRRPAPRHGGWRGLNPEANPFRSSRRLGSRH